MTISIATVSDRAARALVRARSRRTATSLREPAFFPSFSPRASNAQCDVKHSAWRRKISDSLQARNHSRFLNPIGKRLTGAQYFAIQEWHDAVRRECARQAHIPGKQTRKVFSASASQQRRRTQRAG